MSLHIFARFTTIYYLINGIIGVLIVANIALSPQVCASGTLYLKFGFWGAIWWGNTHTKL